MASRHSPASRFLLQASVLFAALLAIWWFVLLDPLREYLRVATGLLISPSGATRISIDADGSWKIPVRALRNESQAGRTIRLKLPERIPNLLTLSLPLFWAVILAAPRSRRMWRVLAAGSAILMGVSPPSLMLEAGYTARSALYPDSHGLGWWRFGAYLCISVLPYVLPVLLALFLHPELRDAIVRGPNRGLRKEQGGAAWR